MLYYLEIFISLAGFAIVTISASRIAKLFVRFKLPLITGLLVMGILSGPFILKLVSAQASDKLNFINDVALAFIAFAAGSELFIKELRSRAKSIFWMTFGQLIITFIFGTTAVYLIADQIHFMQSMSGKGKLMVAMLAGTIFVARSPASAIAIINEMRAKGPFTQTALSVTVVKDVLVIILFSVCFSIAQSFFSEENFEAILFIDLLIELALASIIGYMLGKWIHLILSIKLNTTFKTIIILFSGYIIYPVMRSFATISQEYFYFHLHVEPLLICIVASFWLTNYSSRSPEFKKIVEDVGKYVYVAFFTLTGATLSLDILVKVWAVALLLFFIRLFAMMIGSLIGGLLSKDPARFNRVGWMPYVTQAGVGIGLVMEISGEFTAWGNEFATIIIAVIVLNQIVGPPLFKWSIDYVKEGHAAIKPQKFDGIRDAIIFGLDGQSIALARLLIKHKWEVKIVCFNNYFHGIAPDLDIRGVKDISEDMLNSLDAKLSEAIVLMLTDVENYKLSEVITEKIGVDNLILRLNDPSNFTKFREFTDFIVHPSTSIVNLLDQYVRSPFSASLLLGMEERQESADYLVLNEQVIGMYIRDLRLPMDAIVLSIKRNKKTVVTHGYNQLRENDILTVIGSPESLNIIRLKLEGV